MIEIIPAIDIMDGKCVRLSQGDYSRQIVYDENPVAIATRFEDTGMKRLHLVDLDGARTGKMKNLKVLESIAKRTGLIIDFSGGVRVDEDVDAAFNAGAHMLSAGSIAVKNMKKLWSWSMIHGWDRFIIGADVRNENISISGWQENTSIHISELLLIYQRIGAQNFICTDISKDGQMQGPSIELYGKLCKQFSTVSIIASGGVSVISDMIKLESAGCTGVIIGKAIYEGKIKLQQLTKYISNGYAAC
jgi:phosphoribosylformimino-5-aminoimidazole carboxamide ribotide isomerase